ncbi:MAG: hypothetical protein AABZ08_07035 [Planctomycetota bacterium]
MANESTITKLNSLLKAEYGCLVHRLGECTPFVTWPAADDRAVVQQMLADAKSHQHDLINLILKLRGSPVPPAYPTYVGGVHYLNLSYLMPQVIAGLRGLVRLYEQGGPTGHTESDALASRILSDHKRHLAELERMHSNLAASAAR